MKTFKVDQTGFLLVLVDNPVACKRMLSFIKFPRSKKVDSLKKYLSGMYQRF